MCKSILHNKSNQSSHEGAFSSLLTVETQINFKNIKAHMHVGRILCFLFSNPFASLEEKKIKYLIHYLLTSPHNTLSMGFSISIKYKQHKYSILDPKNYKWIDFWGEDSFCASEFFVLEVVFLFFCDCFFAFCLRYLTVLKAI